MNNEGSELLECIRIALLLNGEMSMSEAAAAVGMSPQAFNEFVRRCRGTQIARAEQILDVLGYDIVIRRRK